MVRHPDIVSGAVVFALGVALGVASLFIDISPQRTTLTAQFFPLLVAGVFAACGVGIFVRGWRAERQPMPFLFTRKMLGVAGLLVAYFLTFPIMDFRVSSWAMVLGGMWVLGNRNPRQLIWIPLIISIAIWLVFRFLFSVVLPTWT